MINVKMSDILNASEMLTKISGYKVSGKYAFAIARLVREVEKEMQTFESIRMELIRKYADKDEDGELVVNDGNVHLSEENIVLCNAELAESLGQNVELNANPLKYDWFDEIEITAGEAAALEPFMEVE